MGMYARESKFSFTTLRENEMKGATSVSATFTNLADVKGAKTYLSGLGLVVNQRIVKDEEGDISGFKVVGLSAELAATKKKPGRPAKIAS